MCEFQKFVDLNKHTVFSSFIIFLGMQWQNSTGKLAFEIKQ